MSGSKCVTSVLRNEENVYGEWSIHCQKQKSIYIKFGANSSSKETQEDHSSLQSIQKKKKKEQEDLYNSYWNWNVSLESQELASLDITIIDCHFKIPLIFRFRSISSLKTSSLWDK